MECGNSMAKSRGLSQAALCSDCESEFVGEDGVVVLPPLAPYAINTVHEARGERIVMARSESHAERIGWELPIPPEVENDNFQVVSAELLTGANAVAALKAAPPGPPFTADPMDVDDRTPKEKREAEILSTLPALLDLCKIVTGDILRPQASVNVSETAATCETAIEEMQELLKG
jgi:hypothetical protein